MKKEIIEVLSAAESKEFVNLDEIIAAGAETFMEVGRALVKMHDGKLYRAEFKTFREYAASRGIGASQGYKLMKAVQVTLELESVSRAPHEPDTANIELLKNSSAKAVGALGQVPKGKRKEVLRIASENTDGKLTAKAIREAAAQVGHKSKPQPTQVIQPERFAETVLPPGLEIKTGDKDAPAESQVTAKPEKEIQRPTTFTPERCQKLIDEIESWITDECDRAKFGAIFHKAAERQMNWKKGKEFSPYTR